MKALPPPDDVVEVLPPVPEWNLCKCDLCREVLRKAQQLADAGALEGVVELRVGVTIEPPRAPSQNLPAPTTPKPEKTRGRRGRRRALS